MCICISQKKLTGAQEQEQVFVAMEFIDQVILLN